MSERTHVAIAVVAVALGVGAVVWMAWAAGLLPLVLGPLGLD